MFTVCSQKPFSLRMIFGPYINKCPQTVNFYLSKGRAIGVNSLIFFYTYRYKMKQLRAVTSVWTQHTQLRLIRMIQKKRSLLNHQNHLNQWINLPMQTEDSKGDIVVVEPSKLSEQWINGTHSLIKMFHSNTGK